MFNRERAAGPRPASSYLQHKGELERDLIEEVRQGGFVPDAEYTPPKPAFEPGVFADCCVLRLAM